MSWNIVDSLLGMTLLGAEWVLWLLLALSVISVAIIIERAVFFYTRKTDMPSLLPKLNNFVAKQDSSVIEECSTSQSPIAKMIQVGLNSQASGKEAMLSAMSSHMIMQKQKFEKGMTFLGTLGNNAVFIGLLGTVIGVIQAFDSLGQASETGPQVVMAGISEALVATAVGLFVAIPSVIAYNVFNRKIKHMLQNAEIVQRIVVSNEKN